MLSHVLVKLGKTKDELSSILTSSNFLSKMQVSKNTTVF